MRTGQFLCRVCVLIQCAVWPLLISGCISFTGKAFSSKWANDDERYAKQYRAPYSDDPAKKWPRMAQQMMDARFESGTSGGYIGGGGGVARRQPAGEGEIGFFSLPTAWSTVRLGAVGMGATGKGLGGGVVGMRLHAPTRWTPYVGVSAAAGVSGFGTTIADHSYTDGNGHHVWKGDTVNTTQWMGAVVPEAGMSYWLTSHTRMNVGASYYVTTEGRSHDFLLFGMSFDFASRETYPLREPSQAASDTIPSLEQPIDENFGLNADPTGNTINPAPPFGPPTLPAEPAVESPTLEESEIPESPIPELPTDPQPASVPKGIDSILE